jgi:hypothetical protein
MSGDVVRQLDSTAMPLARSEVASPRPALVEHSRPQQGADRLRAQTETQPRDRAFLRAFGLIFGAAIVATAATAVIVDPYATFGTGLVAPVVWLDRDEKANALEALVEKPAVVVLGSSRSMKLKPDCLGRLTGKAAFNFAVNSAQVEDYTAIYRYIRSLDHGAMRRLIIGVDPEAFHNAAVPDHRLQVSKRLSKHLDGAPSYPLASLGADLLSWQTLKDSVRAVRHAVLGGEARASAFGPDGYLTYVVWEDQIRRGVFDPKAHIEASVSEYTERYRGFTALSEGRVDAFRNLLKEAKAAGIEVDAFIPPLHPELARRLEANTTVAARTDETEALLRSLEGEALLRFHETSRLEAIGGDPALFFDGAHMMEANAIRLLSKIFGDTRTCALQ